MNSLYPIRNNNLPAIPGLGFKLFGKSIGFGRFLGAALRYVGGIIAKAASTYVPVFGQMLEKAINSQIIVWAAKMENSVSLNAPFLVALGTEPTTAEQAILDTWVKAKFTPWAESLIKEIGSAVSQSTASTKLAAVNIVLQKIDVVQDHYAVAETTGLSQVAIDQRAYLISESLAPVYESIKNIIATLGTTTPTTVTFSPTRYSFLPLFSTTPITSVVSTNYSLSGITIKSPIAANIGKTATISNVTVGGSISILPTVLTPVTLPVVTSPVSVPTTLPTTLPTNVVTVPSPTTTPVTPVSTPVVLTDTDTDANAGLPQTTTAVTPLPVKETKDLKTAYIAACVVSIGAWYYLSRKKKKK